MNKLELQFTVQRSGSESSSSAAHTASLLFISIAAARLGLRCVSVSSSDFFSEVSEDFFPFGGLPQFQVGKFSVLVVAGHRYHHLMEHAELHLEYVHLSR